MSLSYLSSSLQETARQNYVDLVSSLSSSSESSVQLEPGADRKRQAYENLVVTSEDGITKIMLNRPAKMNAINIQVTLPCPVLPPFYFPLWPLHSKAVVSRHHSCSYNCSLGFCRKISSCGCFTQQS